MVLNYLLEYLRSTDVILWSVRNFYIFIPNNLPHIYAGKWKFGTQSVTHVYWVTVDRNVLDDILYVDYNRDIFSNYYNNFYHPYN